MLVDCGYTSYGVKRFMVEIAMATILILAFTSLVEGKTLPDKLVSPSALSRNVSGENTLVFHSDDVAHLPKVFPTCMAILPRLLSEVESQCAHDYDVKEIHEDIRGLNDRLADIVANDARTVSDEILAAINDLQASLENIEIRVPSTISGRREAAVRRQLWGYTDDNQIGSLHFHRRLMSCCTS